MTSDSSLHGDMVDSKKIKKHMLPKVKLKFGKKSKIGLDDGEETSQDVGAIDDTHSEVKTQFKNHLIVAGIEPATKNSNLSLHSF